MRIRIGKNIYRLRKDAELDWMMAGAVICALAFFPAVQLFCELVVLFA